MQKFVTCRLRVATDDDHYDCFNAVNLHKVHFINSRPSSSLKPPFDFCSATDASTLQRDIVCICTHYWLLSSPLNHSRQRQQQRQERIASRVVCGGLYNNNNTGMG